MNKMLGVETTDEASAIIQALQSFLPYILTFAGGGAGLAVFKAWQDKRKQIAAQPVEEKKVQLDGVDRAVANILNIQDNVIAENTRLTRRMGDMEKEFKAAQGETDRLLGDMQTSLDKALSTVAAYRRYFDRIRKEFRDHGITMPEPDPKDADYIK